MEKNICGKCHAENRITRHFCEKCGAFLHTEDFDEKIYALPEMKMMRVVDNLINVPHQPINWDDVIDSYAARIEKNKALFSIPGMGAENNSAIIEKINNFLSLLTGKQNDLGMASGIMDSLFAKASATIEGDGFFISADNNVNIEQNSSNSLKGQIVQHASITLDNSANQSPNIAINIL